MLLRLAGHLTGFFVLHFNLLVWAASPPPTIHLPDYHRDPFQQRHSRSHSRRSHQSQDTDSFLASVYNHDQIESTAESSGLSSLTSSRPIPERIAPGDFNSFLSSPQVYQMQYQQSGHYQPGNSFSQTAPFQDHFYQDQTQAKYILTSRQPITQHSYYNPYQNTYSDHYAGGGESSSGFQGNLVNQHNNEGPGQSTNSFLVHSTPNLGPLYSNEEHSPLPQETFSVNDNRASSRSAFDEDDKRPYWLRIEKPERKELTDILHELYPTVERRNLTNFGLRHMTEDLDSLLRSEDAADIHDSLPNWFPAPVDRRSMQNEEQNAADDTAETEDAELDDVKLIWTKTKQPVKKQVVDVLVNGGYITDLTRTTISFYAFKRMTAKMMHHILYGSEEEIQLAAERLEMPDTRKKKKNKNQQPWAPKGMCYEDKMKIVNNIVLEMGISDRYAQDLLNGTARKSIKFATQEQAIDILRGDGATVRSVLDDIAPTVGMRVQQAR